MGDACPNRKKNPLKILLNAAINSYKTQNNAKRFPIRRNRYRASDLAPVNYSRRTCRNKGQKMDHTAEKLGLTRDLPRPNKKAVRS